MMGHKSGKRGDRKCIQVFEHQSLRYDVDEGFERRHFDALVKLNEAHDNKYFTVIHHGVRFSSYVGVIQVDELTIEILPKIDGNRSSNQALWRNVLLDMLKVCQRIPVTSISEGQIRHKHDSLMDVYCELFLREVEDLVHKGLIKQYRKVSMNQNALKGKLLFAQHVRHNMFRQERFYCEFSRYEQNHLIHQIILKALRLLKGLLNTAQLYRLNKLLWYFQEFDAREFSSHDFERLVFNRKNQGYERALQIAKIIILNYSPTLEAGDVKLFTLLFDMNRLWEEFVFQVLRNYGGLERVSVRSQESKKFWKSNLLRPDLVIECADDECANKGKTFIIDTKWKVAHGRPTNDDLRQMFVYMQHWESQQALLLYPCGNEKMVDVEDTYHQFPSQRCC